ncbi:alpha/beta hydrolase [Paenibacillus sp. TRM 82003]|nr:alpha/beta hydrolase [Paenibacillus sp. TRM 82003]
MSRQEVTLTLKDGRTIGYTEYGRADGYPILLFHGTPGSRLWFTNDDPNAHRLGIRLIALDRPGFGLSTPKPGRTVPDWVDDVAECTERLGLGDYSALGVSGGGPYAAACAALAPKGLRSVAMVASSAPFRNGRAPAGMMLANRAAFWLSRRAPWLMRKALLAQVKLMDEQPAKFKLSLRDGNKHLSAWDRAFLRTEEQLEGMLRHLREAYRQSVDEAIREPVLLSKPWAFALSDIRLPVHIFHGEADRMAPTEEMLRAAQAIPTSKVTVVPGAGHFLCEDEDVWKEMLTVLRA